MTFQFDYEGAKKEGYSDTDIFEFLKVQVPEYDFDSAIKEGYKPEEINAFLGQQKPQEPESNLLQKAGRVAGQFGLGALESQTFPIDIALAPQSSKDAQTAQLMQSLSGDLEDLYFQKAYGKWTEEDEKFLQGIQGVAQSPEEAGKFTEAKDFSTSGAVEKITGIDTEAKTLLEKAANWTGFIKNPKKLPGLSKKEMVKAVAPTGTELMRGLGVGAALEVAEDGSYGPIGKLAATVIGDLSGAGLAKAGKKAANFLTNPKKALADVAATFTKSEQKALQEQVIKDFRDAGIQADAGSITNSNMIRMIQTKLAQSGLTGEPLERLQKQMTQDITSEYKKLANELGAYRNETARDTGDFITNTIKNFRDEDRKIVTSLYKDFREGLGKKKYVKSGPLASSIRKTLKDLEPGAYKSTQQREVVNILETVMKDLVDSEGNLLKADVKDLLNNKIALNQAIDYEVQGGTKQLLKNTVKEIDRAIISLGKDNPGATKKYIQANQRASQHAKTFRNKTVDKIFRNQEADPAKVLNMMDTVQGQQNIEKALGKTKEGRDAFNSLKRAKLEEIVGNNLVDGTSKQLKFQTFPKLLEKKNNREVLRGILSKSDMKRLERLQKNTAGIAESINKFYNSSKTFSAAADAGVVIEGLKGLWGVLTGNPWPLMRIAGGVTSGRGLSGLLADPEFLRLVEDAVLTSKKGKEKDIFNSFMKLRPYFVKGLTMDSEQEEERTK